MANDINNPKWGVRPSDVRAFIDLRKKGFPIRQIAKMTGKSHETVRKFLKQTNDAHIRLISTPVCRREDVQQAVRALFEKGYLVKEIAEEVGITPGNVRDIFQICAFRITPEISLARSIRHPRIFHSTTVRSDELASASSIITLVGLSDEAVAAYAERYGAHRIRVVPFRPCELKWDHETHHLASRRELASVGLCA